MAETESTIVFAQKLLPRVDEEVERGDYERARSILGQCAAGSTRGHSPLCAQFAVRTLRIARGLGDTTLLASTAVELLSPALSPHVPPPVFDEFLPDAFHAQADVDLRQLPSPPFLRADGCFDSPRVSFAEPVRFRLTLASSFPRVIPGCSVVCTLVGAETSVTVDCGMCDLDPERLAKFAVAADPPPGSPEVEFGSVEVHIQELTVTAPVAPVVHRRVSVEPVERDVSMAIEAPPTAIVGFGAPLTLTFSPRETCGYDVVFSWHASNDALGVSGEGGGEVPASLQVREPFAPVTSTIFVSSSLAMRYDLAFTWNCVKEEMGGSMHEKTICVEFIDPFHIEEEVFDDSWAPVASDSRLLRGTVYSQTISLTYLLPWRGTIKAVTLGGSSDLNLTLPIEVTVGETVIAFAESPDLSVDQEFRVLFHPDSPLYPDDLVYCHTVTRRRVVESPVQVVLSFPSDAIQYVESEFSISITSTAEEHLEVELRVEGSAKFLIKGQTNAVFSLEQGSPVSFSYLFVPLVHGNLSFSRIILSQRGDAGEPLWSSQPMLFVNFPSES